MVYLAILYGILTLAGGIFGYIKAGSMPSLISGVISGILVLASALALLKGKTIGYYGLVGLSGILTVVFIMRFLKTHAFMPAGLMLGLSALMLVALLATRTQLIQTH